MNINAAPVWIPEEDRRRILAEMDSVLESGQLTCGEHGRQFESDFATQIGATHAVAVSSGTSALEIILRSLGVENREVIVPTNTFIATAVAALRAGARVRFADVDPTTLCMDTARLSAAMSPDTACVIVVHIGGLIAPDIQGIVELCRARRVWLVEDAAHAHGSRHDGRQAGSFGVAASFSFYPTKVITSAEGGMIVTGDPGLRDEALIYRDQGKRFPSANLHTRTGYNWRLSELHAILGRAQLQRLGEFVAARQRIAAAYDRAFSGCAVVRPVAIPDRASPNYYKYIAFLPSDVSRVELKRRLRDRHGVNLAGEVYEQPCHLQPVLAASSERTLPDAEQACATHICLPVSARMSPAEAMSVADCVIQEASACRDGQAATEARA